MEVLVTNFEVLWVSYIGRLVQSRLTQHLIEDSDVGPLLS